LRERVALLKGLPLTRSKKHIRTREAQSGCEDARRDDEAHGARTCLVSGGFTFFTSRVAALAGSTISRRMLLDDGAASDRPSRRTDPRPRSETRRARSGSGALGISFADTLAVGDGANDLDMIKRAGLGVAYHAKPVVAAAAGASIAHADLDGAAVSAGLSG
jgi:phosphoserine phosphatase